MSVHFGVCFTSIFNSKIFSISDRAPQTDQLMDGVQFDPFIDNETQAVGAAFEVIVVVVVVTDETVTVDILNNTKSFCSF